MDIKKMSLLKFKNLSDYYDLFLRKNYSFFSEINDFTFNDFAKAFDLNFQETYSLYSRIIEIKKRLLVNSISDIYVVDENENNYLYYSKPITSLGLSNRSLHYLTLNSIKKIDELVQLSESDLYQIKNLGAKSIKEICAVIQRIKNGDLPQLDEGSDKFNYVIDEPFSQKTNKKLNELILSKRTHNALARANYFNVDDFINFSLEDFKNIKNMGVKSAYEIYEVVQKIKKEYSSNTNINMMKLVLDLEPYIYEYPYLNYGLSHFLDNNFDLSFISFFGLDMSNTFQELYFETKNRINSLALNDADIDSIYHFFRYYLPEKEYNVDELKISKAMMNVLKERFNGKTLEEIACEYSLTKERIRQMEKAAKDKLVNYFTAHNIKRFMLDDYYFIDTFTILNKEIYELFFIILDSCLDMKKIVFKDKTFYVRKDVYNSAEDFVQKLKSKIVDNGFLLDSEVDLDFLNRRLINYLFSEEEIISNGKTYYIAGTNSCRVIAYIKRFGLIDLSDNNLDNVKKELSEYFDINDFDKHNIVSAITRKNIVSFGDSKYGSLESAPEIDDYVLKEIENTIKSEKIITSSRIYSLFKEKLIGYESHNILYFKLKQLYSDNDIFNFGGVNYTISIKKMAASKAQTIYEYLKEQDEPVPNTEIMKLFKIDKTSLSIIDQQNKDIFYIDDVHLWLLNNLFDFDEAFSKMEEYLKTKNSFYLSDFYKYICKTHSDILKKNFITSLERFARLLKYKYSIELKTFDYNRTNKCYSRKQTESDYGFEFDF